MGGERGREAGREGRGAGEVGGKERGREKRGKGEREEDREGEGERGRGREEEGKEEGGRGEGGGGRAADLNGKEERAEVPCGPWLLGWEKGKESKKRGTKRLNDPEADAAESGVCPALLRALRGWRKGCGTFWPRPWVAGRGG